MSATPKIKDLLPAHLKGDDFENPGNILNILCEVMQQHVDDRINQLHEHLLMDFYYTLNEDGSVEKCTDHIEWGQWMRDKADAVRKIGNTTMGSVRVSTVFLGMNMAMTGGGTPILFETMVFGGEMDGATERYGSFQEAKDGHDRIVESCKLRLDATDKAAMIIADELGDEVPPHPEETKQSLPPKDEES